MKRICITPQQTITGQTEQAKAQRLAGSKNLSEQKLADALELMRDVIRVPLGEDPERDEQIKAAWRSGE